MPSPTATEARVKVVDYVTGAAIGYLQTLNPGTYCVTAEVDDKALTVEFPLKETSTKPRDILKLVRVYHSDRWRDTYLAVTEHRGVKTEVPIGYHLDASTLDGDHLSNEGLRPQCAVWSAASVSDTNGMLELKALVSGGPGRGYAWMAFNHIPCSPEDPPAVGPDGIPYNGAGIITAVPEFLLTLPGAAGIAERVVTFGTGARSNLRMLDCAGRVHTKPRVTLYDSCPDMKNMNGHDTPYRPTQILFRIRNLARRPKNSKGNAGSCARRRIED